MNQTTTIGVELGLRRYDVVVAADSDGLARFITERSKSNRGLIVCDTNVMPLADAVARHLRSANLDASITTVPAGEPSKSLDMAAVIYDRLAEMPADRSTPVIAVGGGVIGDLAGFAAATFNRGLPLFMVPTSLLAMVDSSVGGKVGINHRLGKNLIGAFHQPSGVWIDVTALKTLPDREYRSGLAEVVKYGMILAPEFFNWLEQNVAAILERQPSALVPLISKCVQLKAKVVADDEREETGRRAILNFGHTFAHAFETVAGYGQLLHGEAVSVGMVCACRLAKQWDLANQLTALLRAFGLPVDVQPEWSPNQLIETMRRDKKAVNNKMRFVLPTQLGHVELVDGMQDDAIIDAMRLK